MCINKMWKKHRKLASEVKQRRKKGKNEGGKVNFEKWTEGKAK
jgi:hypothetical protein